MYNTNLSSNAERKHVKRLSASHRAAISAGLRGRRFSDEHRRSLSDAKRARDALVEIDLAPANSDATLNVKRGRRHRGASEEVAAMLRRPRLSIEVRDTGQPFRESDVVRQNPTETFTREVEELVGNGSSYTESVLIWCEERGVEPESIGKLIRSCRVLKSKIECEARELRMLKPLVSS
jgi:hypothetical protein